jgi:molecular chaperone DnaJ
MRRDEAFKILELSPDVSEDEIKKKFKQLAKTYHPDINKNSDAEEKFKKVNEAYSVIKKGEDEHSSSSPFSWSSSGSFDPFNMNFVNVDFQSSKQINADDVYNEVNIIFAESVLGCEKNLSYKRTIKCDACNGNGAIKENNGCNSCNSLGRTVRRQGNMLITSICTSCLGKIKTKPCQSCSTNGFIHSELSISIKIPPGIKNNNVLRLQNMGNYCGSVFMGSNEYTSCYVTCHVEHDDELSLVNNDVVSNKNISLLEALSGCAKKVKTINGEQEINIPPMFKNKDEIILPKLGIAGIGSQRIIINIEYPDKDVTKKIIKILEKN